jgi:Uma2 family endonuclease
MATGALVSVEEYLSTSYRPDCDYVDGVVLERNLGETDHSGLQTEIAFFYRSRRRAWGLWAYVEQRVQVSARRFRIPDVCLVLGKPSEKILRTPPFICIEVLSKDDRLQTMRDRVEDYLSFGVPYVWIIDPDTRLAYRCIPGGGMQQVTEFRTTNPETVVPVHELFD